MKFLLSRLPYAAFILFAALLATALVRHYSDVPFWDMWDGYLGFYNRVLNGDLTAWWYQHNEHRIVLSRILFWMDLAWFGGKSAFLIIMNFLLVVSAALLMGKIFSEIFRGHSYNSRHWLLFALCLIAPLSWMQKESLAWAFQSQFFLAQLLPLLAFYCFYLSEKHQSWTWFLVSLFLGIASAGTMANGVAVLPVLAVVSCLASKAPLKKAFLYGVSGVVVLTIYFSDYQSPQGHGSMAASLFEDPVGMFMYTALYIGSPVHFLLDKMTPTSFDTVVLYFSMASGFLLMLGSLAILLIGLRRPRKYVLEIALLGFIAYLGASAFGTAGGRLTFGVEQALSGRYRTPALFLWLCFLILFMRFYPCDVGSLVRRQSSIVGLTLTILLLVPPQVNGGLSDNLGEEFERNAAVLALGLQIKDSEQIRQVYPWIDYALEIAKESVESEVSIFSPDDRFYRLSEALEHEELQHGQDYAQSIERCQGAVDEVVPVAASANYGKISGWLYAHNVKSNNPLSITLSSGETIGYLIIGRDRPDVARAISENARYSGYIGYIELRAAFDSDRLFVGTGTKECWLDVDIEEYPFEMASNEWSRVSVSTTDVATNHGWTGGDYDRTETDGFKVYESYVNSDNDVGELTITVYDGESIMLRTGPSSQGQLLKVGEGVHDVYQVPITTEWTLLTFNFDHNNSSPSEVTFVDEGTGWGQWSAIAVQAKK